MMHRRMMLAGLAALGITPTAFAAPSKRTVRYAETPGVAANLQSLDIYGAEESTKRPFLAFVHGGGWTSGDKTDNAHGRGTAPVFVDNELIFVSINYRLSPKAKHPAHIEDVAAAIAWLHAHASEFGGDPDRIFIMGHSSGAQLAALLAVDERRLGAHGLQLSTIKGCIALDGSGYDTVRYAALANRLPRGGEMFEDAFGKDPAIWADASPTLLAKPGKGICPFLIVTSPRPVARAQAAGLADALRRAGAAADIVNTDQDHIAIISDIGKKNDPVTAAILYAIRTWSA